MVKKIVYVDYKNESMIHDIQTLVSRDLSEPYSIFTYRFFLHNWPNLCICVYEIDVQDSTSDNIIVDTTDINNAKDSKESVLSPTATNPKELIEVTDMIPTDVQHSGTMIATIVCKAERVEEDILQGYIGMLTVAEQYRKQGIGYKLAQLGIQRMVEMNCNEIILEAEVSEAAYLILPCDIQCN